jgi:hypothetical protein
VHFHVCVVDGVFEVVPGKVGADAGDQVKPLGVIFHPVSGIDEAVVAQVQAILRQRILRAFVARGLIEKADAKEMLAYEHSGFSVERIKGAWPLLSRWRLVVALVTGVIVTAIFLGFSVVNCTGHRAAGW